MCCDSDFKVILWYWWWISRETLVFIRNKWYHAFGYWFHLLVDLKIAHPKWNQVIDNWFKVISWYILWIESDEGQYRKYRKYDTWNMSDIFGQIGVRNQYRDITWNGLSLKMHYQYHKINLVSLSFEIHFQYHGFNLNLVSHQYHNVTWNPSSILCVPSNRVPLIHLMIHLQSWINR